MTSSAYETDKHSDHDYSIRIQDAIPAIIKRHKKSGLQIAREIWDLRRGPGRLTPNDYFQYQLFDDSRYSRADKRRFISDGLVDKITHRCSDHSWIILTEDKWISYQFLEKNGYRVPETIAVIDKTARTFGSTPKISSPSILREFLGTIDQCPIFAKSNTGLGSFGTFMITHVDGDALHLANAERISFDHLFDKMIGDRTYLLQRQVLNHHTIRAIADGLATVRIMNFVRADDVLMPFALLKIPASGNIADNYWRPGNMIANVDVGTGQLVRVVRGKGLDLEELKTHPDNNLPFADIRIPYWADVLSVSRSCATLFAPLRYHSLDIAVTPDGPVIIEINYGGAFTLPQIATGTGLLTDEISDFFRSCGFKC